MHELIRNGFPDSLDSQSNEEVMSAATGLLHKMVPLNKPLQLTLLGLSVSDMVKQDGGISSFFAKPESNAMAAKKAAASIPSEKNTRERRTQDKIISHLPDKSEEVVSFQTPSKTDEPSYLTEYRPIGAISPADYEKYSAGIDPAVFADLPSDIQSEIVAVNKQADLSRKRKASQEDCPDDCDPEVFKVLPEDIKTELRNNSKMQQPQPNPPKKSGQKPITKFFKKL